VVSKISVDRSLAVEEFGMACQRILPWAGQDPEPPFGVMACFLPASVTSAPDCHDQDEAMLVLSGAGTVDVDGERTEISAGELLIIPRNREHVVHNPAGSTLRWVSFYWPLHEPPAGNQ
jgi:mannose-6-phosphate isomerase-like protein (cupin superfamily)